MKISIAQTRSVKGEIGTNVSHHLKIAQHASELKADALFFPELSLTGYEPLLANELAIIPDDRRLDCFQTISDAHKITIGLGVPTKANTGILISMIVFQPFEARKTYSKQQLHPDECAYFVEGGKQLVITVEDKQIAPAICYEGLQHAHSYNASRLGANIYVASVAKADAGIAKAMVHFPTVAQNYSMPVLMSNSVGFCDNFYSGGKSAVWTRHGRLAGQLDDKNEGLLVFDTETEEVTERVI